MDLAAPFEKCFHAKEVAFHALGREGVRVEEDSRGRVCRIEPALLRRLARTAFHDVNFLLRTSHLAQWNAILDDPDASDNDRFAAASLLRNAAVAAAGSLPLCQDTGTATVVAFKGESMVTGADDAAELEAGIQEAYAENPLRFSQMAPLSMLDEANTGTNLPAQIDLYATQGSAYRFLFLAKGGGSSNKTVFIQGTKATLEEKNLAALVRRNLRALGTAACPPYHLALVVGGTSPECNLRLLKLATAGALDYLPDRPAPPDGLYRDRDWETRLGEMAAATGLGAQFGGKYLALDARVIRAARHAGSCPLSLGVSCSAHRNALAYIDHTGVFLESLDRDPGRFLPRAVELLESRLSGVVAQIDLTRSMDHIRRQLASCRVGSLVLLSGPMILARDIAHARFHERLRAGEPPPDYLLRHPVFYAGPAKTPASRVLGSLGPTTAERMDVYLAELMERGASLVTVAKGNRSTKAAMACARYDGFYLGTLGGTAALIAEDHVIASEVIDYADLGMEAVRRVDVRNLPAVVLLGPSRSASPP